MENNIHTSWNWTSIDTSLPDAGDKTVFYHSTFDRYFFGCYESGRWRIEGEESFSRDSVTYWRYAWQGLNSIEIAHNLGRPSTPSQESSEVEELKKALRDLADEVSKQCPIGSDPRLLDLCKKWQAAMNVLNS